MNELKMNTSSAEIAPPQQNQRAPEHLERESSNPYSLAKPMPSGARGRRGLGSSPTLDIEFSFFILVLGVSLAVGVCARVSFVVRAGLLFVFLFCDMGCRVFAGWCGGGSATHGCCRCGRFRGFGHRGCGAHSFGRCGCRGGGLCFWLWWGRVLCCRSRSWCFGYAKTPLNRHCGR